ncbi:hypothetical protein L207DRAFT_598313 [Hyaloscypha variabilis F]|uniref:C2H2-type domain-containing protein n=1 Tax=Hyaloscypha variabilis (strain UAMH 11265 / GT02V1 / F) TaxID=1149755 RepID=A0A2J6RH77_HYAVF|nr:hypothetical protein L207DRAFT_598313 [Hyaloscypha variabilis F]
MSYGASGPGWTSSTTPNDANDEGEFPSDTGQSYGGNTLYSDAGAPEYPVHQSSYSGNFIPTTSGFPNYQPTSAFSTHYYSNDIQYSGSNSDSLAPNPWHSNQNQSLSSTTSAMDPYQSGSAATAGLDHPIVGDNFQNFQDENAMSLSSYSSPPMASSFDAGNFELDSFENTPQQGSVPDGDRLPPTNFPCDRCPKAFSRQYELTKHKKIHDKPLHCEVCHEFGAAEKKDLDRHLWSNHPVYAESNNIRRDSGGECDCGRKYGRSDHLVRHQKKEKHGKYRARD